MFLPANLRKENTMASSKRTATKSNIGAMLANVRSTSFRAALATSAAVAAVQAAGISKTQQAATREAFIVGCMAGLMYPNIEALTPDAEAAARVVIKAAGKDAKSLKDGQSRRTPGQETMYALARYHWSRILKLADVKSTDGRGTKRGTKKTATKKGADASPATPIATGRKDVVDYYKGQAALMLTFANKNASVVPAEIASIIQDVVAKLKALKV